MLRRSVTFVTTEEGYDRFIKECDKLNDERRIMNPLISSSVEPEIFSHEADCIIFGWTNTIWYSECLPGNQGTRLPSGTSYHRRDVGCC